MSVFKNHGIYDGDFRKFAFGLHKTIIFGLRLTSSQRKEMLKSDLLGPILPTSGAKARKCLNRTSWDPFCRLLDPRRENAKIGHPGTYFADFWIDFGKQILTLFAKP